MMSSILIHNETDYELAPWILDSIKIEAVEYFGESIASIRVQVGGYRHGYNVKTREVRYAFFPDEYDLNNPDKRFPGSAVDDRSISSSYSGLNLNLVDISDMGALDETDLEMIEANSSDEFDGIDPEFDEVDELKTVAIGDAQDEFD